jgi:FAD/FMN-containing dehydrogenase
VDAGSSPALAPDDRARALQALAQIVGASQVLHEGDLSAYERDWRGRTHGRALAVLRPGSTEEVAAVVRCCSELGLSIVPQGGNTGLVGASVPDASGNQVLLSLKRLNRIRTIDADNLSLTAEAGCVLQAVQAAAADAGLLFPLSLAAEGSCTLGGNLATNAGGTQVLRFGNARDLCLGLEVVGADGRIWHGLSGLRKDNTGYDLRDLFIGSEGTLGIITAATMKLYAPPRATATATVACANLEQALQLLNLARRRFGPALTGFELMNAFSRQLVARHFAQIAQPMPDAAWAALLEVSSTEDQAMADAQFEALLQAALEAGCAQDAAFASNQAQRHAMWHLRESIPLAQSAEGLNIKHDISLPVSAIPAFVASTDAQLEASLPGVRLVNFGHLGDGNLHYNVQAPPGVQPAAFLAAEEARVNRIVYDAVAAHGGSISAEHGIGSLKLAELEQHKGAVALDWMRSIKRALDPQNLLNPGRLLRM